MERVLFVKPLSNYLLDLTFSDGLHKIVDLQPYIGPGLSGALREISYFQLVRVESGGGIYWPNGYDFCPNFLRDEIPAIHAVNA
jgi:hypothetical protein